MSRMPAIAATARPDRLMDDTGNGEAVRPPTELKPRAAHQNDSGDDEVAAVGEVHAVLDHVADTDGGDHAVEHEADAADDAGGDGVDDGLKLGAEAQDDGQHSRRCG